MRRLAIACLLVVPLAAAWAARGAEPPAGSQAGPRKGDASWVEPSFHATEAQQKTVTVVRHYRFRVAGYPPGARLAPIAKRQEGFGSPEAALRSRFSAMAAADYEWWLSTWTPASRDRVEQRNEAQGRGESFWTEWWKQTVPSLRFFLAHRVELGPYVVLTYHLKTRKGQDAGQGLELPVVFQRTDDGWRASAELSKEPLLLISPWASGLERKELTVR